MRVMNPVSDLHCSFFLKLQTGKFILSETSKDGQYHRPWQPKNHENNWLTNDLGHRIHPNTSSWGLFVLLLCLFLYLPIQPAIHSSIHPSILQILFHFIWCWRGWEAVSLNLKIWRSQRFYFFFHTSLKSSIDYTAYSCYHIYALLQASFLFSSSRLPSFRDLKITARHMTPLSSSFSLSLVGGDLKFCFKTATVPILLNPPSSSSSCLPPSSWVYYLTLLNFSQSYWRPGVHWGVSYTTERQTEIDRDLAACYSTTLCGNKKSFCSFLCYSREIKLGITHMHTGTNTLAPDLENAHSNA